MGDKQTTAALRAWAVRLMQGNLDPGDWTFEPQTDETITIPVRASYSYTWVRDRTRAGSALRNGTIDEQIDAALRKGAPIASVGQALQARPQEWVKHFAGRPLDGWAFAETKMETCDSCRGSGKERCSPCRGSGEQTCSNCRGDGKVRQACYMCHGAGRHARTRQVSQYGGGYQTETYYENCWHCSGGYNYPTCNTCSGSGRVRCSTCGGSGSVACSDCGGPGRRLYRHDRTIMVTSRVSANLTGVKHDGLKGLFTGAWNRSIDGGGVTVSDVVLGTQSEEGLSATCNVAFPTAVVVLKAPKAKGEAWAVGADGRVSGSEPVLARALELPAAGPNVAWPAVAEGLAGKRILREAMAALDQAKGDLKARAAAAQTALQGLYGSILGVEGGGAVASAAAYGVNRLRGRVQRRVWLIAAAAALIAGVAIALWLMFAMAEAEFAGPRTLRLLKWSLLTGPAIGIAAAVASRLSASRLLARLGVKGGAKPPGFGKLFWPTVGVALLPPLAFLATVCAGYFAAWPQGYRERIDGAIARNHEPVMAVATTTVRLRAADSETSEILATVQRGEAVVVRGPVTGGWAPVRYDGQDGWIAARYLTAQ